MTAHSETSHSENSCHPEQTNNCQPHQQTTACQPAQQTTACQPAGSSPSDHSECQPCHPSAEGAAVTAAVGASLDIGATVVAASDVHLGALLSDDAAVGANVSLGIAASVLHCGDLLDAGVGLHAGLEVGGDILHFV
jgi:hypothetical protein